MLLCAKFFYYDSEGPLNVNAIQQLSIRAENNYATECPRNAFANFTVTALPSTFSMGGTSNENDGIAVKYDIHAHDISNGNYALCLGWLAREITHCYSEFKLIVGDASSDYFGYEGGCIGISQSSSNNTQYPSDTLFCSSQLRKCVKLEQPSRNCQKLRLASSRLNSYSMVFPSTVTVVEGV